MRVGGVDGRPEDTTQASTGAPRGAANTDSPETEAEEEAASPLATERAGQAQPVPPFPAPLRSGEEMTREVRVVTFRL